MERAIRVAAVSVNQTPLDWAGNESRLLSGLEEARSAGARLICFPELCLSGYGCEDAFLWEDTARRSWQLLGELLPHTNGVAAAFGLPLAFEGELYDAAAFAVDGRLLGIAVKRHLAGRGLHYEPRWFRPWPPGRVAELVMGERTVPVGDVVFELDGVRIGFEICEDAWVEERPGKELLASDVDVILNPSASHFAFGKHRQRQRLVLEGARRFGAAYVYANLLGNEAGRAVYDGDGWIASSGEIRAAAARFSFAPFVVTTSEIDVAAERALREALGGPKGEPKEAKGSAKQRPVVFDSFSLFTGAAPGVATAPARLDDLEKAEAFGRAVALGLRDYLVKSASRGFVVSLSGGADSAAVALLVRLMVRLGVAELGVERFAASLGQSVAPLAHSDPAEREAALVRSLLVTVYQASANSSEVTRRAAAELAAALGAEHHEWSVADLIEGYTSVVEAALGEQLEWRDQDLALQNIQARARAPGVWMLANVRRALLLSTSNRSEAAVGYATMDGDTAGGLSPLAGIDKPYLRRFLEHVQVQGLGPLPPQPALAAITCQAPTAELRPKERAQTDEADLMPYEVLDTAERAFVVERKTVREVYLRLLEEFPEQHPADLLTWNLRFFRLFTRNQWKRERYAPSFHLDDASLDPKTWLRFPILSSGLERELEELVREFGGPQP